MTLITVSQLSQPWTFGGSEATLRIFASEPFHAADGTFVVGGSPGTSNVAYEVECSLAVQDTIIIPETEIQSTEDSRDRPDAGYTAIIYDEDDVERYRLVENCLLPSSPTTTTWAEITEYNFPTVPSVPDPDIQESTPTDAVFTWSASTITDGDIGGYQIRNDGSGIRDVGNVLTYTYPNLAGGETFEMRAYSSTNRFSNWSPIAPVSGDTTPPSVPTGLTQGATTTTTITVTWNASTGGATGYDVRIDGGAPVDVGNVLTYQATGLDGNTTYAFEVRAYDIEDNNSAYCTAVNCATENLLFDDLTAARLAIYSLRQEVSTYAGAALQIDIGGTPTDITFEDVEAFSLSDYDIIQIYDQSGNGKHLTLLDGTDWVLSQGDDGLAVMDGTAGGTMGNLSYTDLSSKADAHIFCAMAATNAITGLMFRARSASGDGYYAGSDVADVTGNVFSGMNGSNNKYSYVNAPGTVYHVKYDGGGATDDLKWQVFINGTKIDSISTAAQPATWSTITGIEFNGTALAPGTSISGQYRAMYAVALDLTSPEVTDITTSMGSMWNSGVSELLGEGHSIMANSANGGTADPDAYLNVLATLLAAETDTTWRTTNWGAPAERLGVEIAASREAHFGRWNYYWRPHDIKILDALTNDLTTESVATVQTRLDDYLTYVIGRGHDPDKIYVLNVIPRNDLGGGQAAFDAKLAALNAALPAQCAGYGVHLVDIAGADAWPYDTTRYVDEGSIFVHPNDAGNLIYAQTLFDAIQPNL
jgi:hypothetical protein